MKRTNRYLSLVLFSVITLGHHTATHAFLKDLKTWWKGKEEIVAINERVPANCGITIVNLKGDINVRTWAKEQIVIEARKVGSDQALENTKVESKADKDRFSLKTVYKEPKTKCTVTYDVLIPESSRLQMISTEQGTITVKNARNGVMAKTDNGAITLNNVKGLVKTSTNRGSITISASEILPENKILAIAGKGNIKLSVPEHSNAEVSFKTIRGSITSEVPITTQSRTMKFNPKTLAQLKREARGKIGQGGKSAIKLHTGSGKINVSYS